MLKKECFFFFSLFADLAKVQGTPDHLNTETRGAVLRSLDVSFCTVVCFEEEIKVRKPFLANLPECRRDRELKEEGYSMAARQIPLPKAFPFLFPMVLWSQGKEGVHSLTEGRLPAAVVGEHNLSPGAARSQWCTTEIHGASLRLAAGKASFEEFIFCLCGNSEVVNEQLETYS